MTEGPGTPGNEPPEPPPPPSGGWAPPPPPGQGPQSPQQPGVPPQPGMPPQGGVPPAQGGFQSKRTPTSATVALILGILGVTICGLCAPFAWWQGQVARNEIDQSGGTLEGRGMATAGWIMGMIGSALLALGIIIVIIVIAAGAGSA